MRILSGQNFRTIVAPVVFFVSFFMLDPGLVAERLRNDVFDLFQRLEPRQDTDSPVLMVDIDETSLARFGQWPWPRPLLARLVDKASAAGAAVIAFDVIFAEPDRTSPRAILDLWAKTSDLSPEAEAAMRKLPDHDEVFARSIRESGSVVLGLALSTSATGQPPVKAGIATLGEDPRTALPSSGGAIPPLPQLADAAAGIGSVSYPSDPDLIVRRLPLIMRSGDQLVPSLAAEAVRLATNAGAIVVKSTGASGEMADGQTVGITSIRIGPVIVPTDPSGRLILHYAAKRQGRVVSAADLLDDRIEPGRLDGAILFVGTSAAGLKDIRPSPLDPVMAGVEAHVQAVEQMVQSQYLYRPDWVRGAETLTALLLALLAGLAVAKLRPVSAVAISGLMLAIIWVGAWLGYARFGWLVDPIGPSTGIALLYVFGTVDGFVRTERDKRRIRSAFGQYLSPALVDRLANSSSPLRLGGETRETTILFCDIRGFTPLSEAYREDPEGLTRLINRFLTPMTGEVLAAGGTIDKYIGDALMAFWNAPLDDPDHARNAVRAVLAMRQALVDLNASLAGERLPGTQTPLRFAFGIGLNTGSGLVGNVGSDQRFNYSVMGDPVNLAARLEGQCKTYGVDAVLGEATVCAATDFTYLELDLIAVQGKAVPSHIYTVLGDATWAAAPGRSDWLAAHTRMLTAYRAGDWTAAAALLPDLQSRADASCLALYQVYAGRLTDLTAAPPHNWDGVYRATSK